MIKQKYKFINPLTEKYEYWIEYHTNNLYPQHTNKGGKWIIECNENNVVEIWIKIKKLQDKKLLGNYTKVSTHILLKKYNKFLIIVYTYDNNDLIDVLRIRNNLYKNGFKNHIPYKLDMKTLKNIYNTKNEFEFYI